MKVIESVIQASDSSSILAALRSRVSGPAVRLYEKPPSPLDAITLASLARQPSFQWSRRKRLQ